MDLKRLENGYAPANGRKLLRYVNPYVTDGLVAWWDGIWNAGLGIINDNAADWTDLIGGIKIPGILSLASRISNGYMFTVNASKRLSSRIPTPNSVIECVVRPTVVPDATDGSCFLMPNGDGVGIKFVVRRYDDSTVYVPLRYAAASSGNRARKLTLSVGQIATVSVFAGGDTAGKGYLNGAPVTATVTSGIGGWTYGYRTSGQSFVGGNLTNGSKRAYYGEVLSVRCYDRYITAEEVAFNRAADKQRFNLP